MKFFISYKRKTGIDIAGRIHDYLVHNNVEAFYDINSMKLGFFDEQIYREIETCDYFVLVLSLGALDNCYKEDDWVRKEIEHALSCLKPERIIPIIYPGFEYPNNLPQSLKNIPNLHGINYDATFFNQLMEKLFELIGVKNSKNRDGNLNTLLFDIYDISVDYRNSFKKANQDGIFNYTNKLMDALNKLYFKGEELRYFNPDIAKSISDILGKFNNYVNYYNMFAESSNRMSQEAQEYAKHADNEFMQMIDLVLKLAASLSWDYWIQLMHLRLLTR